MNECRCFIWDVRKCHWIFWGIFWAPPGMFIIILVIIFIFWYALIFGPKLITLCWFSFSLENGPGVSRACFIKFCSSFLIFNNCHFRFEIWKRFRLLCMTCGAALLYKVSRLTGSFTVPPANSLACSRASQICHFPQHFCGIWIGLALVSLHLVFSVENGPRRVLQK